MIRGIYTSSLGMQNNQRKLETVSTNLANISTNGYKRDLAVSKSFSEVMTDVIINEEKSKIGAMELGVGVNEVVTDYSQGNMTVTDNPLDVAITDADLAFFCIEVKDNNGNTNEMYTRNGSFTINNVGQLVTKDGNIVKGENGPIILTGESIIIGSDGTILQDGEELDKFLIKQFTDAQNLKKHGNNLLIDTGNSNTEEFSGSIVQGTIETSNVNSITEMVDMINIMRTYETNQKVLQAQDETLKQAVSEVGRL